MSELRLSTENTLVSAKAAGAALESVPVAFDGYRLVHSLGEGGMGEVWLAEQLDPVRRNVAVKIIKAGMDTKEVVARFESERQALAMMDHRAIAKIFDAGKTPEGRPYFVMEYVDGLSITEHCDRHRLSTTARLELLAEVCDGVQHAHQKAVIHRDLKPSNILVATVDGTPQPKVIDFGIAKAIGYRLSERTLFTELGAIIGTPEYMSPEQADSTGQDVDTRTDVYSLGVILYELLSAELPFSSQELRASSTENLRRILRERDPLQPSQRVRRLGRESAQTANARSTDPATLTRQLEGDLDAITLRAMEKERDRRYGTATELAEDIRRCLRHEPVLARPPSRLYRARKYLRRHRMGVSFAAAVAGLLLAFTVTALLQAARTARERDRANREAAAASNVSEFLTRMFKISDPGEARGNSITAREILDRASDDLATGLRSDPALRGRMMDTIGGVYENLGLRDRAATMLENALEIRRHVLGPDHPDALRTAASLGLVYSRAGRYAEAEPLLLDTISRSMRVNGPRHPETLVAMNGLAALRFFQGRLEEAEGLDRSILEGRRQLLGPEHPETLSVQTNLGVVLSKEGHDGDALVMLSDALDRYRQVRGPEHPDTLNAMNNLGLALSASGRPAEGEALFRQLLEIRKRVLGPEHPDTLGTMGNLANALMRQNRASEAEPLYRQVLEIERRVLGPDHQDTFRAITGLASALSAQGRLQEAEALDRELLAAERRVLGPEHRLTGLTEYNLAGLAARSGRSREALDLLRQSLGHHLPAQTARHIRDDEDFLPLHGNPEFEAIAADGRAR